MCPFCRQISARQKLHEVDEAKLRLYDFTRLPSRQHCSPELLNGDVIYLSTVGTVCSMVRPADFHAALAVAVEGCHTKDLKFSN